MTQWYEKRLKSKAGSEGYISDSAFCPTESQKKAMVQIKEFLESEENHEFTLQGPAGSGKTTLVNHVLKEFNARGEWIAVTSFTNKATNVISRKTPFADSVTLFRLLGLTLDPRSEKLTFKKTSGSSLVKHYTIIVLDEVSMVQDEHLDLLIKQCSSSWSPIKLLLMGDRFQFEPVGQDTDSKAFSLPNYCELTEVVRHSQHSNIHKYSSKVVDFIKRIENGEKVPITTKIKIEKDESLSDLFFYNKSKDFLEALLKDFNSDEARQNSDYVKVIAYRNKTVTALNVKIRESIFGKDIEPITKKDELILNAPVKSTDFMGNVVFDSSDEITILSVIKDKYDAEHMGVKFRFPFYYCEAERNFDGARTFMNIVHPNFYEEFKEFMKEWAQRIKSERNFKTLFKNEYYPFQEKFHLPSYNYALTSHKAQGSTYNKVYVVEDDIERVRMALPKNLWKSKYVAYTRASEELHILNRQ